MKFIFTAHMQKYQSILQGTGIANTHSLATKPAPRNILYTWTKWGIFTDVHSADKTLMEKIKVIEQLDEHERNSIYHIIDGLFAKKKLKDNLSQLVAQ